jgi:hypothetical protein
MAINYDGRYPQFRETSKAGKSDTFSLICLPSEDPKSILNRLLDFYHGKGNVYIMSGRG